MKNSEILLKENLEHGEKLLNMRYTIKNGEIPPSFKVFDFLLIYVLSEIMGSLRRMEEKKK